MTSKRDDAVLLAGIDYDALTETAYLLRTSTNAQHLLESLNQARRRSLMRTTLRSEACLDFTRLRGLPPLVKRGSID